jgi:predicted ATPase
VNLILGANGVGKTNLYNSIALLRSVAKGELAKALAAEGGLVSSMWAGARPDGDYLRLGITVDDLAYDVKLAPAHHNVVTSRFKLDPDVKEESISLSIRGKKQAILKRGITTCTLQSAEGRREDYTFALRSSESALAQIADPHRFPHISQLRSKLLGWRFYHAFRADAESPLRRPQVAVRTYSLSEDGLDLAARYNEQTISSLGYRPPAVTHALTSGKGLILIRLQEWGQTRVISKARELTGRRRKRG